MQIKITDITPFMKKGWVAMDKSKRWFWYNEMPVIKDKSVQWSPQKKHINTEVDILSNAFDIAPADDWTRSLIKIDNTAREKFEEEYQSNIQRTIQELNNK